MPTVELSYEQIESLINEISLGGRIVSIKCASDTPRIVFISHCTGLEKARAEYEFKVAYEKALEDGILTSEETRDILIAKGELKPIDEDGIARLENKIKGQEAYISKLSRVPSRKNQAIDNLNRMKSELEQKLLEGEVGLDFSAEKIAYEQKYLYMAWRGAFDLYSKELIWPTKELFDNEKDLIFRRGLFLEIIRLSGGTELGKLRYLARNNIWRIRYLTALKTGESLFGRSLPEYTTDQLSLAYWSHYYQSVYEMMPDDRPPDTIIEDDAALDAYMHSYMDEMNREATSARESKHKGRGSKSAWDHGETLVMQSNPLYSDIEYSETIESVRNKNKTDLPTKSPTSKKR